MSDQASESCDQQIIDQRLHGIEQSITDHEKRLGGVEERISAYGERIKSMDDRVTMLVQESSGQKEKLDKFEQKSSRENAEIIEKVSSLSDLFTDQRQNTTDISKRLRVVETNVTKAADDLADYKEKNASLLQMVQHGQVALIRVEKIVGALVGDLLKAFRRLAIHGLLYACAIYLVYHYLPGLKPMIKEILASGLPG